MTVNIIPEFQVTFLDYPDPESYATVVYFLGCEHKCSNCHSPDLTDYDYEPGVELSAEELYNRILAFCSRIKSNKVVLSGGDPLSYKNWIVTKQLLDMSEGIDYAIYTGHSSDHVSCLGIEGFQFLKCGKYLESEKQKSEKTDDYFKLASKNQGIYDSDFNLLSKDGIYKF